MSPLTRSIYTESTSLLGRFLFVSRFSYNLHTERAIEALIYFIFSVTENFFFPEIMKLKVKFLLINILLQGLNATFCDQGLCSCDNGFAVCIDVTTPWFRPEISTLYLERVQLVGIVYLLESLPNLKYLTMIDMLYFNCDWMKDIPQHIVVTFEQCSTSMDPSSTLEGERLKFILNIYKSVMQ